MTHRWRTKRPTAADEIRRKQYASPEHKARRKAIQAQIDTGQPVACWRCGRPIVKGSPWHLGHDDRDRTVYRGAECPTCNLTAAARKGARVANGRASVRRVRRRNLL